MAIQAGLGQVGRDAGGLGRPRAPRRHRFFDGSARGHLHQQQLAASNSLGRLRVVTFVVLASCALGGSSRASSNLGQAPCDAWSRGRSGGPLGGAFGTLSLFCVLATRRFGVLSPRQRCMRQSMVTEFARAAGGVGGARVWRHPMAAELARATRIVRGERLWRQPMATELASATSGVSSASNWRSFCCARRVLRRRRQQVAATALASGIGCAEDASFAG